MAPASRSSHATATQTLGPVAQFAKSSDGVSICWGSSGSGPTMVLLPNAPLGDFSGEWHVPEHRDAFEALGHHFRLIQYDGRGTARSQRSVPPITFEQLLLDLDAVLHAARARRPVLFANYLAVTTALEFALRHPDRVSRLVVFGGGPRGWDAMGSPQSQALLSLIEQDWETFVASSMHAWLGSSHAEAVRLQTQVVLAATTPGVTRQMLAATSGVDQTDRLRDLRVPLLVFARRDVRHLPVETARRLADGVPDGRLVVLDGAVASLLTEGFDPVLREILAFTGMSSASDGARSGSDRRPAAPDRLSTRESEVLRLVAAGESNAEIAARLGLSVNTVERHVSNVYRKIDARGRADATAWAIRHGVA